MQFSVCPGPGEQGKAVRNRKVTQKLLTKAGGRAKFGWEEKASRQRTPQTRRAVSANKDTKRKIVSAQVRFADYLQ